MSAPRDVYASITLAVSEGATYARNGNPAVAFSQSRGDGPVLPDVQGYSVGVRRATLPLRDVPLAVVPVDSNGNTMWVITVDAYPNVGAFLAGDAPTSDTVTMPLPWATEGDKPLPSYGVTQNNNNLDSYGLYDVTTFVALFNEILQLAVAQMDGNAYRDPSGNDGSGNAWASAPPLLRFNALAGGFEFIVPDNSNSDTMGAWLVNDSQVASPLFYTISFSQQLANVLTGFRYLYRTNDSTRAVTLLPMWDPPDTVTGGAGESAFFVQNTVSTRDGSGGLFNDASGSGVTTQFFNEFTIQSGKQLWARIRQEVPDTTGLCNTRSIQLLTSMNIPDELQALPEAWGSYTQPSGAGGQARARVLDELLLAPGAAGRGRGALTYAASGDGIRWNDLQGSGPLTMLDVSAWIADTDGNLYQLTAANGDAAFLLLHFRRCSDLE